MPVVSNASPILSLAIINGLHLLQRQFGEVLIPGVVLDELKATSQLPGAEGIRQALQAQWIKVSEPRDIALIRALALDLDPGEAAAIALALELGSRQVLMDEHDGRARARALGLQPVGVLAVLLRAKRDGDIASVKAAIQRLRAEAGFFVDDDLAAAVLAEAGEAD